MSFEKELFYRVDENIFFEVFFDGFSVENPWWFDAKKYDMEEFDDWEAFKPHYIKYKESVEEQMITDPNFQEDVFEFEIRADLKLYKKYVSKEYTCTHGEYTDSYIRLFLQCLCVEGKVYWSFGFFESDYADGFPDWLMSRESQIPLAKLLIQDHPDRLRMLNHKEFLIVKKYFESL